MITICWRLDAAYFQIPSEHCDEIQTIFVGILVFSDAFLFQCDRRASSA